MSRGKGSIPYISAVIFAPIGMGRRFQRRLMDEVVPNDDGKTDEGGRASELGLGRASRMAVRVLASVGTLSFSFMLIFVVMDAASRIGREQALEPPGSLEARLGAQRPGETVHITGASVALMIGVSGLISLVIAPTRAGSANQAGAAAIAMMLGTLITGNPDNHGGQAGLLDPAFLILAMPPLGAALLARPWRAWHMPARSRPEYFVLAAMGIPGLWYGSQQALIQRNTWPPLADPHHQAHWLAVSIGAISVVLAVAVAGLPGRGWRVAATTGGLGAVMLATASLTDRSAASAFPGPWGVIALLWGLAVLWLTYKEVVSPGEQRL